MKNSKKIANINTIILENKLEADASVRPEHKENTQKGVTLLALIVTIIVLLILSLVSVQLVTKSGIIERVKQGVIQHKLQEIHENVKLDYISLKIGRNLNVISMSNEIKDLQKKKYKKYIENVSYTSTKVFYKMTDKLDGKEYMIDIKTGEIGTYVDKLARIEGDSSLWIVQGSTIIGYKGTDDLLQNVVVPNIVKRDDGTEVKITNVSLSNINFEGTLTFASRLEINSTTTCNTVENIVMGDNVTINSGALKNCNNTQNVKTGRNLSVLGEIFQYSKVEEATVESLSKVGSSAFNSVGQALKGDIVINEGVTTIGNMAFKGCSNITSVSIPSTVTEIGSKSFENCTNLKTAKLPENIKKINSEAFYNCNNLSDEITIKEGTTIEKLAFSKTGISKVTIENGVVLPVNSFNSCSKLEKVIIKDNVTINMGTWNGDQSFSNCDSLKTITMGKNIKMHNEFANLNQDSSWTAAFYKSNIEGITVESLSEVGPSVFYNVGQALKGDIVINEGVTTIGGWAFRGCGNITSVSIPSTVTEIGSKSFENCTNLKTAKLPENIKKINSEAFYNCNNLSDEITIKEGTTIEKLAFSKTGISKVTIENGVVLPVNSFNSCSKLEKVIIKDNVTINMGTWNGDQSFSNCDSLKTITMGKNIKMHNEFANLNQDSSWTAAFYKSNIEGITVESLSEVGPSVFYNVGQALKGDIVINEGVTTIGGWAFRGCGNITSVSIPSTVTEIKSKAFENCKSLKTINVNMTKTEWEAVTKGSNWNTNVTAEIVFLK